MVGDLDKSSFSNIEQQGLEFVKYTLDPWVVRWEAALTKALLNREEKKRYEIRFNVDGLLRVNAYESLQVQEAFALFLHRSASFLIFSDVSLDSPSTYSSTASMKRR